MRIIVVGATGTIGSAVVAALSARHEVVAVGNKNGPFGKNSNPGGRSL